MARTLYEVSGQQWLLKDRTMSWACPRLSVLGLFYRSNSYADEDKEMDDGMALLLAVQKRWSVEHEIPAPPQPNDSMHGVVTEYLQASTPGQRRSSRRDAPMILTSMCCRGGLFQRPEAALSASFFGDSSTFKSSAEPNSAVLTRELLLTSFRKHHGSLRREPNQGLPRPSRAIANTCKRNLP